MQKKIRTRIWSILLSMTMLLSLLPVTVLADNEVAQVGDNKYTTLADAIAQAPTGSQVQLLQDATETAVITIPNDKEITLDLGGHKLTLSGSEQIDDVAYQTKIAYSSLNNNGSLTILNGTVDGSGTYQSGEGTYYANTIANKGNLTIGSDAIINGNAYAICNMGGTVRTSGAIKSTFSDAIITYGGEVIVEGGSLTAEATNGGSCITVFNRAYNNSSDGAQVYINGGTLTAYGYVVSGNNLYSGGNNPPLSNVTITGGTLRSTKYSAIYWPISGTLTIGSSNAADTPTITSAGSAVEICSGTLMIHNGKLSSTAPSPESMNQTLVDGYRTYSGSAGPGDAVTIISRRGNGYVSAPLSVTIDGGTFSSTANYAIRYMDCNLATDATQLSQNVTVQVTGGTFNSQINAEFVQAADKAFITGGTFSTKPNDAYIPANYECVDNNNDTYTVKQLESKLVVEGEVGSDGSVTGTLTGAVGTNGAAVSDSTDSTITGGSTSVPSTDVTVNLTKTSSTTPAATTTLEVNHETAATLNNANSLTIKTDAADISFNAKALGTIAQKASIATETVKITVENTTNTTTTTSGVLASYQVSVQAGATNLLPNSSSATNGTVTITVPVPSGSSADNLAAWYVQNGVYVKELAKATAASNYFAFTIDHLSDIYITSKDVTSNMVASYVDNNGTTQYCSSLADAITKVQGGGTVTLENDTTFNSTISIEEKTITLDLNGKTATFNGENNTAYAITLGKNAKLTINDSKGGGELVSETYRVIKVGDGTISTAATGPASLVLNGGTVSSAYSSYSGSSKETDHCAIAVYANSSGTHDGTSTVACTVEVNGATVNGGIYVFGQGAGLTVNEGAQITSKGYAISGNGTKSITQNNGGTKVTINGGTITQTGGTTGQVNTAIYQPQAGELIINGGTIKSDNTAVEVRSGSLTVTGGTITGGSKGPAVVKNGNGPTTTNTGIAIAQHTTKQAINVNITGGTITGSAAVYESNPQTNDDNNNVTVNMKDANLVGDVKSSGFGDITMSNVAITGAVTKDGTDSTMAILNSTISSGTVPESAKVYNCVDGNGNAIQTGQNIGETTVAIYNNTEYADLNGENGALDAAKTNGGTVYLVKSTNLTSTIAANVTLDVAQNITLTIEKTNLGTLIGSAGKIKVNAGGGIVVDGIAMIGDSESNINLQSGSIELQVSGGSALALNFNSAVAEIPANHRWTLLLNDTYKMNPTLDAGSTLTVNGSEDGKTGFHVANGAKLTNNGTIVVNTSMSIGSSGEVTGSGTITVNAGGVLEVDKTNAGEVGKLGNNVTNSGIVVWNGSDTSMPTGTITLLSGGKVYSQADIASKISGSKAEMSNKTYSGDTFTYAWQYYVAPSYTGGGSSSSGDYLVSVESSKNGTVSVSPSRADKGDTVTITVKPSTGYELDTLTVTDKDGNSVKLTYKSANKYTFTMPGSKVTVKATFAEISEDLPFTDVAAGAWYADAVQFVYENGLMTGITATTFGPNVTTSRAMLATILYRLEGEPNVTAASFTDVESGMYYTDAVAWASSKGIVTGYGDGTFLPNKAITREEMAAMLYRYASYKGYDVTNMKDLSGYSDAENVSSYAVEALQWATGEGLVTNMDGALNPTGSATRAQLATILMRFLGE